MKKILVIIALLALLVACKPEQPVQPVVQPIEHEVNPPVETTASEPSSGPQTVKVDIAGFKYVPASVKIKVGDTVTWTQVDTVKHTVTIVTGPENFDSGLLTSGQTYSHTFTKPGTYSYKCTPHPNMRGEVIVE